MAECAHAAVAACLFRFAVAFFVLINFPFDAPVQLAARILHVSVDIRPNGSGFHWINEFPFNR